MKKTLIYVASAAIMASCSNPQATEKNAATGKQYTSTLDSARAGIYTKVSLSTDLTLLSDEEKQVIGLFIEAAQIMDQIFWQEAFPGSRDSLINGITDENARQFAIVNYGPWDRLDGDISFIKEFGEKPAGSGYYPLDITAEEFEKWNDPEGKSPYTMIRRDDKKQLKAVWYHEYFKKEITQVVALLRKAAGITSDPELKFYLTERALALETDQYTASDIAWLSMKNNHLDLIIGPIENYEDKLMGLKTSHEAYVLVKDMEWSKRLEHYSSLLPGLQKELPCEPAYKKDPVGSQSQLAAYDIIYYAGDCNSGSKTIAVNLPNDETIQQEFGTRRSQLKNAMRAKYDKILVPLADMLIADDQRQHITFDAFFGNVMFHEVAHGLGVKNLVGKSGTVRDALKEQASALEEEKADVLGLWLITKLYERGELKEGVVMDNYVTFLAGIFRSCRFGASSAHGKANMHTFNFLKEKGAFSFDATTGKYRVDFAVMVKAIDELAGLILRYQGNGDYNAVKEMMAKQGVVTDQLEKDLKKANDSGIPVDVVFEQGKDVLKLK